MRLANELRDHREMYVAIVLLIVAVVLTLSGCNGMYEPLDANGQYYRPWNEDPYAKQAHWMDKYWCDPAEAKRILRWKAETPSKDWIDRARR